MFFKPREVLEAEDWLKLGNLRAAGNALLRARQNHKDIVKCKQELARLLVGEAQREWTQGAIWAADEALRLAEKLAPLSGEDAVFAEQLRRQLEAHRLKQESLAALQKQAQCWLQNKQYQDVITLLEDFLRHLGGNTLHAAEAALLPLLSEARTKVQRLDQLLKSAEEALGHHDLELAERLLSQLAELAPENDYRYGQLRGQLEEKKKCKALSECLSRAREAIRQNDLQWARVYWRKALELDSEHQELRQLTRDLVAAESQLQQQRRAFRVQQPTHRFVLGERWLVISSPDSVLGLGRDGDVNVPLMGRFLHNRHVRILRERSCYQLVPCLDKHGNPCPVYVNQSRVTGGFRLQSGDVIALGDPSSEDALKLCFLQPVAGSGTAILQAMPDSGGRIRTKSAAASDVIFLDKEVMFAPQLGQEVHVVDGRFPCCFLLFWTNDGLQWQVVGGVVTCGRDDFASASQRGDVFVPGTFYLESINTDQSEAEFLASCFRANENRSQGLDRNEPLLLRFTEA